MKHVKNFDELALRLQIAFDNSPVHLFLQYLKGFLFICFSFLSDDIKDGQNPVPRTCFGMLTTEGPNNLISLSVLCRNPHRDSHT